MGHMRSEFSSLKSDVLVMGVGDRWRTVQMVEDGSGGYPGRTPSYRQRLPTNQLESFPPAGGYPPASVGGGAPRLPAHQLESFPPAGGYPPASVGGGAPRLPAHQLESFPPAGGYPPASVGGGAPRLPAHQLESFPPAGGCPPASVVGGGAPRLTSGTAVPSVPPPFITPEILAYMRQNPQLLTTPSKPH